MVTTLFCLKLFILPNYKRTCYKKTSNENFKNKQFNSKQNLLNTDSGIWKLNQKLFTAFSSFIETCHSLVIPTHRKRILLNNSLENVEGITNSLFYSSIE